jgi:hypothetical protein
VYDVDPSDAGSAQVTDAKSEVVSPGRAAAKIRRLIAGQRYFGVEAQTFHDGAKRTLARLSTPGKEPLRIDVRSLGEDFRLDAAASWTLLRAMLADGLLRYDGPSNYQLATRFREYALAEVITPLSRSQAKALLERARKLALDINADWERNPFLIKMILVSGSYMSRSERLPELSLWLMVGRRPEARTRRWKGPLSKSDALRQIAASARALSSFIVVRVVTAKESVERPFSVVFQSEDNFADSSTPSWGKFREWGASISRRLSTK